MKKITMLALGGLCLAQVGFAQKTEKEINYINPPAVRGDFYTMELDNIKSEEDFCKLKIGFENKSKDQYLRYNFAKTGFHYTELGTYFSDRGKDLVVGPGDKRSGVAQVKGNANYMVPAFELRPEGLSIGKLSGFLSMENFPLELGKTNSISMHGFEISTLKTEQSKKKDKFTAQVKITYKGAENEMGWVSPQTAVLLDKNGAQVAEFSLNPDKLQELLTDDDFKLNISVTSPETSFSIAWVNVFQMVQFQPFTLPSINIKAEGGSTVNTTNTSNNGKITTTDINTNTNSGSNNTASVVTNCPVYQGTQAGKVKVNIHNVEGECFTMTINGAAISQTTNATLNLDYGKKDIHVQFSGGYMLDDKITIYDTWEAVTYRIKKNKKDEYVMNLDLTSVVLNEKGKAMAAATQASAAANQAAAANNTANNTSNSNSGNTSGNAGSGSNSSSNNTTTTTKPEPSFSNGSTTVKLKITYKGVPAADTYITIKHGDAFVGNNKTDGSGNVSIKTNNLLSSSIDVYGEKGSYNWSVSGMVGLNSSNYAELDLYEVAKFMAEMMGGDPDNIARGWGF